MTTPDLRRLRDTLRRIDDDPRRWDQSTFTDDTLGCGTTHCVAGWANALEYGDDKAVQRAIDERPDCLGEDDLARELLGLTREEAHALFFGTLTPSLILTPDEVRDVASAYQSALREGLSKYGTLERTLQRAAVQKVCDQVAARAGESL